MWKHTPPSRGRRITGQSVAMGFVATGILFGLMIAIDSPSLAAAGLLSTAGVAWFVRWLRRNRSMCVPGTRLCLRVDVSRPRDPRSDVAWQWSVAIVRRDVA
ncbi:hypothetical protein AB7C87_09205 [Natrarchaeobius sp. A-rgal3]|uniref:hypothetical protein n=1 Tax=Natrarchaeobius versutus TaxID=1679078 RepID=UPI00350F637F